MPLPPDWKTMKYEEENDRRNSTVLGTYLGDGVYVAHDGYALVLNTSDGEEITNRIVLEPEVYAALVKYVETLPPTRRPK